MNALIEASDSFLLVVDVQEKLAPAIDAIDTVVTRILALTHSARALDIPVIFTEHCPDRIGRTVPALIDSAPNHHVMTKSHFGTLSEPEHAANFARLMPKRPIVCGTEAHVCVLQTVFGLLRAGTHPLVVVDAVGSRRQLDKDYGLERMREAGAELGTAEMVIFECLRHADHPEFNSLISIIKAF